ncbi:DNA glycosylase AlkZ-like family protein [Pedococcus sp. 2YAF34]|uniref:DNA glycosylase AlkZ-like family protein n=1 Tax=Pedococcus sp. 2YAF34 TaxID=3233032 RepID=UPI003F9800F7
MGARSEASVSWPRALAWRLGRQLLDPVGDESVGGVVQRLGAVPAMDDSLAELAVRTRRTRSRPGELAEALADGEVVKAFAFRGAVHYLSPEDGGAYLALRAAGRQWERTSWVDFYGLTPQAWPAFRTAVREALSGGPLTVAELGAAVTRHRDYRHLRAVFDDGAGTLVKPLTWQGDMGFGPPRGGRATFQRLDTTPRWQGIPDLDEAGHHAVESYFRSYGPATRDHVHYWLGNGLSAGRRRIDGWLASLSERLVPLDVDGTTAYVLHEDVEALLAAEPSNEVRFLPGHDQWVMGPGTKDESVTPASRRDAVTRKANLVIVGGVVSGTWKVRADHVEVTGFDDDRPVPRQGLEDETRRLGSILGRPVRLALAGSA